jgi:hypothetical protein
VKIFISQRWRASASRKAISLIRPLHVRFKALSAALYESITACDVGRQDGKVFIIISHHQESKSRQQMRL